ncbi:MAG: hypothetical protein H7323_08140 [Frankiales bacterium]|nr:hypothetical protein [Frankiales bacterium]
MLTSPVARRLSAFAVLLLALLGSVLLAAPAQAAEKVISITADGLMPRTLTIAAGDTVVLVNDDAAFRYRATSTTDNWSFDSGLIPLAQGQRYALPAIGESGAYGFTVFQNEQPFTGTVTLPAPGTAAPRPVASPSRGGSTGGSPSVQPSAAASPSASSSGSPAGGTGAASLPPLSGGFGAVDTVPSPVPGGIAQAPTLAAPPGEVPGPAPQTTGDPTPPPALQAARAVQGDLPGAGTSRGDGLPAVLAAVLAAGVASLLVRLLLAEPAARRVVAGLRGPDPAVTVD